jgi:hypothetical protein
MKNLEIVLTKGHSPWVQGKRWVRGGREILCAGTLNRIFNMPKRAEKLVVVFSKDKPRHRQAYTLMPNMPPPLNTRWGWHNTQSGRYLKEFTGQLLTGADLILHSKYKRGYRYVWLEV